MKKIHKLLIGNIEIKINKCLKFINNGDKHVVSEIFSSWSNSILNNKNSKKSIISSLFFGFLLFFSVQTISSKNYTTEHYLPPFHNVQNAPSSDTDFIISNSNGKPIYAYMGSSSDDRGYFVSNKAFASSNSCPTDGNFPLENLTADINDTDTTINFDTAFSDPNGDNLTYTLVSNTDASVASTTFTGSGNYLVIDYLTEGTTTLTIQASDGTFTHNQSFTITLTAAEIDTDGDGISDSTDLDDDNDGILDTDEGCILNSSSGTNLFINGSLTGGQANQAAPTPWLGVNTPDTENGNGCAGGTATCAATPSVSNDGGTWVGLASDSSANFEEMIYQGIDLVSGVSYTISFEQANYGYIANSPYNEAGAIQVLYSMGGIPDTQIGLSNMMVLGTNWEQQAFTFTPTVTGTYNIGFNSVSTTLAYLSIDGISISEGSASSGSCTGVDTDNDGIPNHLDTDSDGDGCSDAEEAGFTDADEDGQLDGTGFDTDGKVTGGDGYGTPADTDNSGTADHLEAGVDEACNPTPDTDTDGDGVPDNVDLDDDNDGIYDIEENCTSSLDENGDGALNSLDSGFMDENNDGIHDNPANFVARSNYGYDFLAFGIQVIDEWTLKITEASSDEAVLDYSLTTPGIINNPYDIHGQTDGASELERTVMIRMDQSNTGSSPSVGAKYPISPAGIYVLEPNGNLRTGTFEHVSKTPALVNGLMQPGTHLRFSEKLTAGERLILTKAFILQNMMGNSSSWMSGRVTLSIGADDVFEFEDTGWAQVARYPMDVWEQNQYWQPGATEPEAARVNLFSYINSPTWDQSNAIGYYYSDNQTSTATNAIVGSALNGSSACSDTDGDGIPNYLDIDSDGDGCSDAKEAGFTDANNDGEVDGSGYEADGTVTGSDGYGTPADRDNSGIADYVELGPSACDNDNDGVDDSVDLDDDNDGILDTDEGDATIDTDNDGTPDYLDTDSDGDGCSDAVEAGFTDANEDGQVDGTGVDADGKVTGGDGYTTPADVNNSGTADHLESLILTCFQDTDGDYVPDVTDLDDDNDGILDTDECPLINIPSNITTLDTYMGQYNQSTWESMQSQRPNYKSYEIAAAFGAGQRTVLNGTFLKQVYEELTSTNILYIGIPKDPIYSTYLDTDGVSYLNFDGPFLRIEKMVTNTWSGQIKQLRIWGRYIDEQGGYKTSIQS